MLLLFTFTLAACARAVVLPAGCDVSANTQSGMVCGKKQSASNGDVFASFKGMRYAKAPFRELRFAEPQPPERHEGFFIATEHGPVCPQVDIIYGASMQPKSMGEDCLRVNVYTPLNSLPDANANSPKPLLPVLVWIHGGAFSYGSGDSDVHGPEYLMSGKGIILVTFNYRLNVFGFMSLATQIPGNAGLRDCRFALQWVQNNIAGFGGDPAQVTLAGQSAGAVITHTLSISPAIQNSRLFNRILCLSGTATAGFYSYYPTYHNFIRPKFLLAAGIHLLQFPAKIYQDLINAPIEKLLAANKFLLDKYGLVTLTPIIETPQPGFTTIIPKDPEILVNEGYGREFVNWLQFTDNESYAFKKRLEDVNMVLKFRLLPSTTLPMNVFWSTDLITLTVIANMHMKQYFRPILITLDKFIPAATDEYFKYPVIRLTEKRLRTGAVPTYVSQFGFYDRGNPFKRTQNRDWPGAAHAEDIAYFFRVNSMLGPLVNDELVGNDDVSKMKQWMTDSVAQFVKTGSPVAQSQLGNWPPTDASFWFQNIVTPFQHQYIPPTPYMVNMKNYFDNMNAIARRV